jgi:hypothetical protein
MNFDEAFKHYREGTATEEEKILVHDELAKAKGFSTLFDDEGINVTPAPIKEAEVSEIRAAKKEFKWSKIIYALCGVGIILVVLAIILGGVFGAASSYADKQIAFDKVQCVQSAKQYAYEFLVSNPMGGFDFISSPDDLKVTDVDKEFRYDASDIEKSYYEYRVTLETHTLEIKIDVDTRFANSCKLHSIGDN